MHGPRQLFFFQCGTEMPKGWTLLHELTDQTRPSFSFRFTGLHCQGCIPTCTYHTLGHYVLSLLLPWRIKTFSLTLEFFLKFIFRVRGREKDRERNINVWLPLIPYAPKWGPGWQPRHGPWLWSERVTLWFTGQHSIHWAPPAEVDPGIFKTVSEYLRNLKISLKNKALYLPMLTNSTAYMIFLTTAWMIHLS